MLHALGGAPEVGEGTTEYLVDDEAFFEAFESARMSVYYLSMHAAHIRMAWIYLSRFGLEGAMARVRAALKRFFATKKIDPGAMGYHETITVAWLRLVDHVMRRHPRAENSIAFCGRHPYLMNSSLLKLFYTDKRLYGPEAKRSFVEPDVTPLPAADAQRVD